MALMDMKSNLSWYGKKPATTNAFQDTDAKGFIENKQQHDSDFVGIHPANYLHTGNQGFGVLGVSTAFENIHNTGFTVNIMPPGTGRPESQFIGIGNAGTSYESTSLIGKLLEGYTPIADKYSTRFIYNSDQTVSIQTAGFESKGVEYKTFATKTSLDGYSHNYGDAKRMSQLGGGSTFPIGPEGQIHNFDKERFGFSSDAKYGDAYGVTYGNSGLADTYTKKSPIDDMYDKFNLRDDATPNSYIKHPLNLRGIQRDGGDPQRYGLALTPGVGGGFDIPRGGLLTATTRTAIDVARIAKFMASPSGLGFAAKQIGYQLMNPMAKTRLWNPLSLGSLAPTVHIDRHISGGAVGELFENVTGADKISTLSILRKEDKTLQTVQGMPYGTLSIGVGGPGSVMGIGTTLYKKHTDSSLKGQVAYGDIGVLDGMFMMMRSNTYLIPYQRTEDAGTRFNIDAIDKGTNLRYQKPGDRGMFTPSLKSSYELRAITMNQRDLRQSTTEQAQFGEDLKGFQIYESIKYKYGRPYQNFRGNTNNGFTIEDVDTDGNRTGGASESPFNSDGSHFSVGLRSAYEQDLNFDQKDILQSTRLDGQRIIYLGSPAGIRTNVTFTAIQQILYSEEKRYYEGGQTRGDVDSRSGGGDSPHGKDSLKERVGKPDFKGGGNNEPEDGQYSIFRTQNYEQLKRKAEERQPNSTTINNFLRDAIYNTAEGETNLEEKLNDSEFKGGGNNVQEEGQAANNEFETNSYEDIKKIAGDRVSKPGERFLDNDFRTKQNYETSPGSTELEKKTTESSPDKSHIHPDKRGKAFDGGGFSEQAQGPTIDDYKSVPYASFPTRTPSTTPTHHDFRDIAKSQPIHGASGGGWDTTYVDELHKPITENENSLINFNFGGIKFKAHLGTLGEAFAPGWDGQQDQGRADPRYLYTSFERTLSLDFIVAAFNAAEQDENWVRLQKLARLTYPKYGGSGFYGQDINVTIGDMFQSKKMIITDLGYDWDNETPWEIESGKQAPMYTAVNMSLTVLGDKPQHTSTVYNHV